MCIRDSHSIPETTHDLSRVVYGQGSFLAFASGRALAYRSQDGVRWKSAPTQGLDYAGRVRFLHGRFVAPGPNGTVLFSTTGLRWSTRPTPATQNLECVTYGHRRYVAGGDSVIVSSKDGIKWRAVSVPIPVRYLRVINGWFVAIGGPSEVIISRDALDSVSYTHLPS